MYVVVVRARDGSQAGILWRSRDRFPRLGPPCRCRRRDPRYPRAPGLRYRGVDYIPRDRRRPDRLPPPAPGPGRQHGHAARTGLAGQPPRRRPRAARRRPRGRRSTHRGRLRRAHRPGRRRGCPGRWPASHLHGPDRPARRTHPGHPVPVKGANGPKDRPARHQPPCRPQHRDDCPRRRPALTGRRRAARAPPGHREPVDDLSPPGLVGLPAVPGRQQKRCASGVR
jgi:hypothetical protein